MSGDIGLGLIVVEVDLFLSMIQPMMEGRPPAPEFLLLSPLLNLPDREPALSLKEVGLGISQPACTV